MAEKRKTQNKHREPETNPRALAAASLVKWEKCGKYAGLEIDAALDRSALSAVDRGLYHALVCGVVERAVTLDHIIGCMSERPADTLEPIVRAALRMGLYQLLYMDRIPEHAAVSESVTLVPKRAAGFVNGVLRNFIRGGKNYPMPMDLLFSLSIKYSVPKELCLFLLDKMEYADVEGLLSHSFGGGRTCLHVNTLRCSVDDAIAKLRELGTDPVKSTFAEDVIVLLSGSEFLSGIDDGLWYVQDEASAAAIEVLSPMPGSLVVDTCAAPGGKSFAAAIAMKNQGRVVSMDVHENKLSLIRDGARRLGIDIIEAARGDAGAPPEDLVGAADFVICDAPCSGLGVMAKKPDIRYKSVADIKRLPEVQYRILTGASKCVRPGGTLLYSTCTVNPAENEEVIRRFAAGSPDFAPSPFDLFGMGGDGYATLLPHKTGTDGFFISRFVRKDRADG